LETDQISEYLFMECLIRVQIQRRYS